MTADEIIKVLYRMPQAERNDLVVRIMATHRQLLEKTFDDELAQGEAPSLPLWYFTDPQTGRMVLLENFITDQTALSYIVTSRLAREQELDAQRVRSNRSASCQAGATTKLNKLIAENNHLPDAYGKSTRRNSMTERHLESCQAVCNEFATWFGPSALASSITESDATRWADAIWESGIAPHTFNIKISCMRVVWNALRPRIGFTENPWNGIKKQKDDLTTRRTFTDQEIKALLSSLGDRYGGDLYAMCVVGRHTGMRISDCAMLKWSDIDFEKNTINVRTIKTGQFITIPMHHDLRVTLAAHHEKLERQYAAAKTTDWTAYWLNLPSTGRKGRVTNVVDGRYTDYAMPRMAERYQRDASLLPALMRKTLKNLGLQTSVRVGHCVKARPVLGFHSFRHGLASRLAEAGVSEHIAMLLLGHKSERVHEAYVHCNQEMIVREFSKLQ